jgi:hypothetical protein
MQVYAFAIATLIVGFVAGIIGQRSGLCLIGGYRDYYLFKDTYLLKGALAFILAAILGYTILAITGTIFATGTFPWAFYKGLSAIPGTIVKTTTLESSYLVAAIGGFGVGFFSALAGGCPFRQHIMASEGSKGSIAYVIGWWIGVPITYAIIYALGLLA